MTDGYGFSRRRHSHDRVRRMIDVVVVLAVAPVVVPLVLVLALVIKLNSPGPTVVSHERLGRAGRRFRLFKLRTMVANAEELKRELAPLNVLPWPDFKIPNDPRVTRVGRVLRRLSLDELPQLWNVLRGEMTLVGPRACSVDIAKYALWQTERLEAVPGLFGRWQAEWRGRADFSERSRLDIAQVRSTSVADHARLTLAGIVAVLAGRGAS